MSNQAKSLSELKNLLVDYARPNVFDMLVSGYPVGTGLNTYIDHCGTYIKSVSIPTVTIGEIPINRLGRRFLYPGDITYGELAVVFRIDLEFKIYEAFKVWHSLTSNYDQTSAFDPSKSRGSSITISQLSHMDNETPVFSWSFYNAYPSLVSEIAFSMEEEAAVQEFTVTFKYSHMAEKSNNFVVSTGSGEVSLMDSMAGKIKSGISDGVSKAKSMASSTLQNFLKG